MDTVQQLLEIAFFAREKGVLALDEYCRKNRAHFSDPFLFKAVNCMFDIKDARLLERVLDNYIIAGNYNGQQFFRYIVIEEAVLAIYKRTDVDQLFSFILPSLFGLESEECVLEAYRAYIRSHGYNLSMLREEEQHDMPTLQ